MKNALILHGTDFDRTQNQRNNNWFPWLKHELEQLGYAVCLPELPRAWQPDIERYWESLKSFDFNQETMLIGHSSGAAAMFGLLDRLPLGKRVGRAISVAGFYRDEGWNCEGLQTETYDWPKIRRQAGEILLLWSPDDLYISREQTDALAECLNVQPIVLPESGHFNLEKGERFRALPEVLEIIGSST